MLRSEICEFETPNAIDPGEMPPAQPRRKESTPTKVDSRPNDRPFDSRRTQRLFSTTPLDVELEGHELKDLLSTEEKKEDEAQTRGNRRVVKFADEEDAKQTTSHVPEIEDARKYAEALLLAASQTGRTSSSRDPVAGWRRNGQETIFRFSGSEQHHSLPTVAEVTTKSLPIWKKGISSSRDPFVTQSSNQAQKEDYSSFGKSSVFIRTCTILLFLLILIGLILVIVAAAQRKR